MSRAELVGEFEPHSPEWHQARATGLGGSEIAAVMGLNPWESRFSLWHRKAGLVGEKDDTPSMSWGRRLEPVIADKFAEDHPELRTRHTGTWRARDRPWQIANPDRLVATVAPDGAGDVPSAILEVKTAHSMDGYEWGEQGTDEIPVYYRCQGLWYLDVLGFERCYFAVLIGGSDYREYVLKYDPVEAAMLRDEAENFLTAIKAGDRPEIDESDVTYRVIRQLHPDIDYDTEQEIPAEIADHYIAACQTAKQAASAKDHAAAVVLDLMGSAQYAVRAGERFARRVAIGDNHPPHLRQIAKRRKAA